MNTKVFAIGGMKKRGRFATSNSPLVVEVRPNTDGEIVAVATRMPDGRIRTEVVLRQTRHDVLEIIVNRHEEDQPIHLVMGA
ncbi:MAG TPA: hypothetical protein VMP11_10610 [Verrucomicrobiae bacterium]|nr:hypothetical protein [Verrucomicrobiae bacterium]